MTALLQDSTKETMLRSRMLAACLHSPVPDLKQSKTKQKKQKTGLIVLAQQSQPTFLPSSATVCCSLECSPAPAASVQSRRSRGVRPSARRWTCRSWRKIGSCRSPAAGMCSCRARSGPGIAFSLCCPRSSESYCRLRPRQDHSQKLGKQSATFFLSLGFKLWAQQTCRHVCVLSPRLLSRAQGCAAWTSPSVRAFSSRSWSSFAPSADSPLLPGTQGTVLQRKEQLCSLQRSAQTLCFYPESTVSVSESITFLPLYDKLIRAARHVQPAAPPPGSPTIFL